MISQSRLAVVALVPLLLVTAAFVLPATFSAPQEASTDAPGDSSSPAVLPPTDGRYLCPPGGAQPIGGGVCALRFGEPLEFLHEPVVAVDARNPEVRAVAAITARTDHALDPMLAGGDHVQLSDLAIFVSSDAGTSWSRVTLPPPPPPNPQITGGIPDVELWDPQLAFDLYGALHVVGVIKWQTVDGAQKQQLITHISTPDLGQTWTPYQTLGPSRADHPWMMMRDDGVTIDIVWTKVGANTLGMARSVDAGVTWTGLDPDAPPVPCNLPSQLVQSDAGLTLVCPRDERFASGPSTPPRGAYRYDEATSRFHFLGTVPEMSMPYLFALPDGGLVVVAGDFYTADIIVVRSDDGGVTWTSLPNLGPRLERAAGWTFLQFMGGSVDPWGNLQLLMRGLPIPSDASDTVVYAQLPLYLAEAYSDDFEALHVVLDPANGDILSEALLTPHVPHTTTSPSVGYARAGDYWAIDFVDGEAIIVWEYHRSAYLTRWAP